MLVISRDTCSDSIAKCFRVCFCGGYRTIIARYVAKWGIAQMCLCETKYQGRRIAPFWGSANLPEKVSRDMGHRSDSRYGATKGATLELRGYWLSGFQT